MTRRWMGMAFLAAACTPVATALVGGQKPAPVPAVSSSPSPRGVVPSQLPPLAASPTADPDRPLTPYEILAATFPTGVPVRPKLAVGTRFFSRTKNLNMVFKGQSETLLPLEVSAKGIPVVWPTSSPVKWQSSNTTVVSVSSLGVVEAVGEGTARVVATEGAREAALPVEVRFANGSGHFFDQTIAAKRFTGPVSWMSTLPVYVASTGPGDQMETYRLRALESLKMWQTVNGDVHFSLVQDPDLAYITIDWNRSLSPFGSADFPVPAQAAAMTLTQGSYSGATDQVFNRRLIHCLVKDGETGKAFSADEMQKILTHEVGHALGIGGHSLDSRDIMYAAVSADNALRPSVRDIETLKWALFATPNFISFQVLKREAPVVCRFR